MKQFVIDIIRRLYIAKDATHVGVVSFSTQTVTNFHLKQYYDVDKMAKKIWDMTYLGGNTNTADGILVTGSVALLRQFNDDYRRFSIHL